MIPHKYRLSDLAQMPEYCMSSLTRAVDVFLADSKEVSVVFQIQRTVATTRVTIVDHTIEAKIRRTDSAWKVLERAVDSVNNYVRRDHKTGEYTMLTPMVYGVDVMDNCIVVKIDSVDISDIVENACKELMTRLEMIELMLRDTLPERVPIRLLTTLSDGGSDEASE